MAKKPTSRKREQSALGIAAEHVALVAGNQASYSNACLFAPGWLIGYDGVVGAGYRISEELNVAVDAPTLHHALSRAGEPYSLTAMPNGSLVVRGQSVRVTVPGFPPAGIPNVQPDMPLAGFSEAARGILASVSRIATARAERVILSAVDLRRDSAVATSGDVILEGWHGCNLPGRWLLPIEFIETLRRVKFAVTHCGWSDTTFTLWFGPHAWIRTNVYSDPYPDTDIIFARLVADLCKSEPLPMPQDCLLAVETLKPFKDSQELLVNEHGFNTKADATGASYRIAHGFPTMLAPFEGLRQAAMHGDAIGFIGVPYPAAYWYGKELRGAFMCKVPNVL